MDPQNSLSESEEKTSPEEKTQLQDRVKQELETPVGKQRNGSDVSLKDKIEEHRKRIAVLYPDYMDPKETHVIPYVYAPTAKVTGIKEGGKGFFNERVIRSLLLSSASKSTLKYFVVHGHMFHITCRQKSLMKLVADELRNKKIELKDKEQRRLQCETDFILLHPKKGIIFNEVYGGDKGTSSELLSSKIKEKKMQCQTMCQTLKAFVKFILQSGSTDQTVESRLDRMFDSFSLFVLLPSLSREDCPPQSRYTAPVDHNRCTVLYAEDCENADQFRAKIEAGFQNIKDQELYQAVYKIAFSCIITMRSQIISSGLELKNNPQGQRDAREGNLEAMDDIHKESMSIFLSPEQLSLYESKERIRFVEGIAGTGKTLICFERMKLLTKKFPDDQILYLCFGETLSEFMKKLVNQEKLENVTVLDFKGFCQLLKRDGELDEEFFDLFRKSPILNADSRYFNVLNEPPRITFLNRRARLEQFKEYLFGIKKEKTVLIMEWLSKSYQHVFVDEYQDFLPYYRFFLEETLMKRLNEDPELTGSFWVFYDDHQSIHEKQPVEVPEDCVVTTLDAIYRSTFDIARFFMRFFPSRERPIFKMGHEYCSQDVQIVYPDPGKRSVSEKVLELKVQLKEKEGYKEEDILVIINFLVSKEVQRELRDAKCQFQDVFQSKGQENKVVILIGTYLACFRDNLTEHNMNEIYIGVSRAQWRCIIVVENKFCAGRLHAGGIPINPPLLTVDRSEEIMQKNRDKKQTNKQNNCVTF